MKRALFLVILLCMQFVGCSGQKEASAVGTTAEPPAVSIEETVTESPAQDFSYISSEDGIEVAYIGTDACVVVPAEIMGQPVVAIQPNGFAAVKDTLQSVRFPDTLTRIGAEAFADCINLSDVLLPEGLQELGARAFAGCASLEEIVLPANSVHDYSWECFNMAGIKKVVFAEGITCIPAYFLMNTNVTKIELPSTVQKIEYAAFANTPLMEILLPEGLEEMESCVFANTQLTEIVIPSTAKGITEMTFSDASSLERVYFAGDAPEAYVESDPELHALLTPANVQYTIGYHEGASGFASPIWNGYPTMIW